MRHGRVTAGLTQVEAAARLGVSQPYLSQLERGRRAVTDDLAKAAARLYGLPPTAFPLPSELPAKLPKERLPHLLATLEYPGYSHLRKGHPVNPALVVLSAVSSDDLDGRAAEAMPWVLQRYHDLDWKWLVAHAKLLNRQNRLGFLVTVARELAERRSHLEGAEKLRQVERDLEPARLAAETTLGRGSMPPAERDWLREHRSPGARHWHVLSGLRAQDLPYAS